MIFSVCDTITGVRYEPPQMPEIGPEMAHTRGDLAPRPLPLSFCALHRLWISLPLFAFRVSLRVMRLFGGQNISGQ